MQQSSSQLPQYDTLCMQYYHLRQTQKTQQTMWYAVKGQCGNKLERRIDSPCQTVQDNPGQAVPVGQPTTNSRDTLNDKLE